jgi:hypothetical protein
VVSIFLLTLFSTMVSIVLLTLLSTVVPIVLLTLGTSGIYSSTDPVQQWYAKFY